jgi:uncharacterized membrane protein
MRGAFVTSCLLVLLCSCGGKADYPPAPFDGTSVRIRVAGLPEKEPRFYSLSLDGKRIDFLVIKIDGEIGAYFDACLECYRQKLGFRYEEGRMTCKACGVKLPLDILKTGFGGCFPIHLRGTLSNDMFVITKEALLAGRAYF